MMKSTWSSGPWVVALVMLGLLLWGNGSARAWSDTQEEHMGVMEHQDELKQLVMHKHYTCEVSPADRQSAFVAITTMHAELARLAPQATEPEEIQVSHVNAMRRLESTLIEAALHGLSVTAAGAATPVEDATKAN